MEEVAPTFKRGVKYGDRAGGKLLRFLLMEEVFVYPTVNDWMGLSFPLLFTNIFTVTILKVSKIAQIKIF